MDIHLIFSSIKAAEAIASYFGIIESQSSKMNTLLQSDLNAARRYLSQAENTVDNHDLINDARRSFTNAIPKERGLRKVEALLGLALCQHLLSQKENSLISLHEINQINPISELNLRTKSFAKEIFIGKPELYIIPIYQPPHNSLTSAAKIAFSKDYQNEVLRRAAMANTEVISILNIQKSIRSYINTPIPWYDELFQKKSGGPNL